MIQGSMKSSESRFWKTSTFRQHLLPICGNQFFLFALFKRTWEAGVSWQM